jgi:hypothetical protein
MMVWRDRWFVALVVAVLLVAVLARTGRAADRGHRSLRIEVGAGGVTADIGDAARAEVVRAIADRAGFRLVMEAPVDGRVTASWHQAPLERVLHHLLAPADLVLVYAAEAAAPRLVEVRVYPASGTRSTPDDLPRATAAGAAEGGVRSPVAEDDRLAGLVDGDDHRARRRAVEAPARHGDVETLVGALESALVDEDPGVREAAVRALGATWDERAVPPLAGALGDPDADVREAAARALGNIWSDEAADTLGLALADRSRLVREAAVTALAWLADARTLPPLVAALHDPAGAVREQAADALASLGSAAALAPLLATAATDEDPWVRERAEEAIRVLAAPD